MIWKSNVETLTSHFLASGNGNHSGFYRESIDEEAGIANREQEGVRAFFESHEV